MAEEKQNEEAAQAAAGGSLLDEIVQATKLSPSDEGYSATKQGVQAFIDELLKPERAEARVSAGLVDEMIADIDKKLGSQMDSIIHSDDFQKLESSWRSLKFLVDRTDFRENIKIEFLNVNKQDLFDDFEDAPEVVQSGLYKTVYTSEYGQFGGKPFGLMVGNYQFGPGTQDVKLLQHLSSVSSMSHAPFIGGVDPKFFGIDDYTGLPNLKDIKSILEMPQYAKWQGFRESEDSRNVGLALPHFLLRAPYDPENQPVKTFTYNEAAEDENNTYLWGNAAFAMATTITDSFAHYRLCSNIIGPQGGGTVADLSIHNYEKGGEIKTKVPTEVLISERKDFELSEEGFMVLSMRKGSDNAAFFAANSCQKPKQFANTPEGKAAELNYKLGTQLPYNFVVARLAHYLKVLQRENIGLWKSRNELETELNKWISQYISDQENPSSAVRSRRPLRKASVEVADVEGDPGWYKISMKVQPHFKYMGASFTLSLVGKLDKK